jgi:hypothetical protein
MLLSGYTWPSAMELLSAKKENRSLRDFSPTKIATKRPLCFGISPKEIRGTLMFLLMP